ncbi:MAG: DUF4215 domain-containing protein [Deltaproteobacteria bacterium]|nr:DUF4215 domain-containing protein [Deltaproteobacteria bacterium]
MYKAWITPVADIGPNGKFLHNRSKTDNFKVRESESTPPPEPACGDHFVDAGEQCDDGNTASGDGCSATCMTEMNPPPPPPPEPCCGDHNVDPGESCDDGNLVSGDGCSATCQVEPPPPPPPPPSTCGNEILETGEECDDGNMMDGDGCSSMCKHEVECEEKLTHEMRVDG